MRFILRSPLHKLLSDGLAIISFTGRKSGKKYSTPVAYHMIDANSLYVFTRSKWWKNFNHGETVQLRIKGKKWNATATITEDKAAVWEIISGYLEKYDGDLRRVGVMGDKDMGPEEIRKSVEEMVVLHFKLVSPAK